MPERLDAGAIYYRAKADALGALVVGAILTAFAGVVEAQDGIAGIPFSEDLGVMSRYLALPLGVVLILANIRHVVSRGPTLAATEDGIIVMFTRRPIGLIRWSAINSFLELRHQGKSYLGITLEDPDAALEPFKGQLAPLLGRFGPASAHLRIHEKMLDDPIKIVVADLEEMRHVRSWRG